MDALFVISLSLTVAVLVAMTAKAAILCRRLARISPRYVLSRMLSLQVPAEVSISNSELCALVSNMLDNALNACEDVDPGKRFVVFKASVKGSYLVLDMRNSKSTSEGDEGRETTRRGILGRIRFAEEQTSGGSLAEHGWGLSVIDTIVQRYDGAVSLERSKAGFRMSVMVDLAAQT